MAAFVKTAGQQLLGWQDVATANTAISTPQDVSTKLSATVMGHIARRSGTAFTAGWPNLRIEASAKATGEDQWYPVFQFLTTVGTAISNTTLNGTVTTGAQSFTVVTSQNIQAGDMLYLGDTIVGTPNWEVVRVKSVSGNVVTPEQALTKDHNNGAAVTDQAEKVLCMIDLMSISRLRAVFDNVGSGQTAAVELFMVTGDSIG